MPVSLFQFVTVTVYTVSTTQSENDTADNSDDWQSLGILKAGRLEKLVDHLVPCLVFKDPLFVPTFLCTYQRFTTTQQVLDLLFTR
jgi:hypothetical protein